MKFSFSLARINFRCLVYSFMWFVCNAVFGLAPLIFLLLVNPILKGNSAAHEIEMLINSGLILFVCCALMGAVTVDMFIDGEGFRNRRFFALCIAPFAALTIVCFLYILIILDHVSLSVFSKISYAYTFMVSFTVIYCIFGKYLLFSKSKNKED